MTDMRAWQIAFLEQARSDWDAYQKTIAHEIEALAPALAQDGPNPEYPWRDKWGHVYIPAKHSFPLTKFMQSQQGTRLLKYIRYFLVEFEKLFLN